MSIINTDILHMSCTKSQQICQLSKPEIIKYLTTNLTNWSYNEDNNFIYRRFEFKNFKQTMFFVNAIAYICEKEMHHPDMKIGFNYCEVELSTHDAKGVSLNDIICANKINILT